MKKTVATLVGVIVMVVALHAFRALQPGYAKVKVSVPEPGAKVVKAEHKVDTVKAN